MVVLLGRGGGAAELIAAVLAVPVAVAHGPDGDAGAGELAHVLARAAPHLVPAHLRLLVLSLCRWENISVARINEGHFGGDPDPRIHVAGIHDILMSGSLTNGSRIRIRILPFSSLTFTYFSKIKSQKEVTKTVGIKVFLTIFA